MKRLMLVCVMILCLVISAAAAEGESIQSNPLVGIWAEYIDYLNAYVFTEFTADGLCVTYHTQEDGSLSVSSIELYEDRGDAYVILGRTAYDRGLTWVYTIDGSEMTQSSGSVTRVKTRLNEPPAGYIALYRGEGYIYTLNPDGDATIIRYWGDSLENGILTIPAQLDGHTVTAIGATYTGQGAFKDLRVQTIIVPISVTEILPSAFSGCGASRVELPESVTHIGRGAFSSAGLSDGILLPSGITEIEANTFANCSFSEITIPEGVVSIGANAFQSCAWLKNVFLPDGLHTIGHGAFSYCEELESIAIPDSVVTIDGNPFHSCPLLTNISITENNPAYCVVDGVVFNREMTRLVCYPAGLAVAQYTIPDGVTVIGEAAFTDYLFWHAPALEEITIPDSVTCIESNAFGGCGVDELRIPDSVTWIGAEAFDDSGIRRLILPARLQQLEYGLCMNSGLLESVILPKSLVAIGENAFLDCTSLDEINLPSGVTEIRSGAFYGCEKLSQVVLPEGLRTIGVSAFHDCVSLRGISLPASIEHIDSGVFDIYDSRTHERIIIPGLVITVPAGSYAAEYCREQGILYEYSE